MTHSPFGSFYGAKQLWARQSAVPWRFHCFGGGLLIDLRGDLLSRDAGYCRATQKIPSGS
jgi:hypothetical protein